ncbi:helix-turn-helix domain-containing protein [Mesorhizobium sp. M7A.F.Ca.AU.002.06.1.1]|uniref:helix-turn-helix domain-containing protein n=1 Tax=Mesorhizobium ciceri TaxID=39645 RepID=UPI0009EE5ADC|nr:helix-turn-helix domain-containing protein [Mesorhizobium sp. Primo-B]RUU34886.1 helix-turn-helix domain-containing protein [Mesorhizobium sp. Primo-A]RVB83447.1 helix-turn-helix domain-containing protein [Mesorhizobium sp. M7A.F.Ca.AU.002.04.1.1]RVB88965.1 helix-turn-helix domain-containing protein [Mesorhizobium sp. M7A.F.Ca.AU.002.03.1.1]RVC03184.1 helix-turn-helix domain-containing protein [Mesorhizobium sp. M7A.F.Ca.AU.002.06.1.1]RVC17687.1 helix-turn-helix domain-containing protein [M
MEAGDEAGSVARGPENAEVSGLLSRWNGGDLSMMEAGELLGMSERQFRRYRERYEEAGEAGLLDRRLGKLSTRRVPRRGSRRCWNFIATTTLAGT